MVKDISPATALGIAGELLFRPLQDQVTDGSELPFNANARQSSQNTTKNNLIGCIDPRKLRPGRLRKNQGKIQASGALQDRPPTGGPAENADPVTPAGVTVNILLFPSSAPEYHKG